MPADESLMQALAIFGTVAEVVHPAEGSFDLAGYDDPVDAILAVITRHPMRQEELERALAHLEPGKVQQVLADLQSSRRAQVVERYGMRFWSAARSFYPAEARGSEARPEPE